MRKIYLILVLMVSLVAFTQCKTTNKARGSTSQFTGTWTAEIEKWNTAGENSITLARKAESSKDVSLENMPVSTPAKPGPAATPPPTTPAGQPGKEPKEAEKEKSAQEKEKEKKEEVSKINISLVLKANQKTREVSGTLTRTQGGISYQDTVNAKIKSNSEFEGDYKTSDSKTWKISGKLNNENSLVITTKV